MAGSLRNLGKHTLTLTLVISPWLPLISPYSAIITHIGSCESDIILQKVLFSTAQNFENTESACDELSKTDNNLQAIFEELKKMTLVPYRVSLLMKVIILYVYTL